MDSAGYSTTPLAKKLGIKPGSILKLINEPEYYFTLFSDLPETIELDNDPDRLKDIIHYFETEAELMKEKLLDLKREIKQNGAIWVSWFKKSSKRDTDITEDIIRDFALLNGLVDIKVCAIDKLWSGLKLVIPVNKRRANS